MPAHRFEIGECVTYLERRFPNGVHRTALVVVERLPGANDPQYQLRGLTGLDRCVLAETQLSPTPSCDEAARRLDRRPADDAVGHNRHD